ncbi:PRC-barrel domain-containing protein [Nitrosomonas sp. Nm51]|uniref:PRC-barrel domain-containing protein n=1 Tax=Nitrosomonas sp. Nm51 TaxID=133720 RepID=UPI0008B65E2B|nr:PRC-barrel domain-containing protein [Nitrosomonas sp. Nm51]SEQ74363.1 PRC-barrel domain-containing protein [Nitrosomonas sp. Nm51]
MKRIKFTIHLSIIAFLTFLLLTGFSVYAGEKSGSNMDSEKSRQDASHGRHSGNESDYDDTRDQGMLGGDSDDQKSPTKKNDYDRKDTGHDRSEMDLKFAPANLAYTMNAKKLLEMDIVDGNSNDLGKIDDLVLSHNEKATYAIVSAGGLLGIGDKLIAVPLNDLKINEQDEKIVVNLSEDQLKSIPEFKYEYVGDRNYQTDNRPVDSSGNSKYSATNIDFDINAKKLFDSTVIDRNGKELGEIEDFVLDDKNTVTYTIVSVDGILGMGDKSVAIPFQAFRMNETNNKMILNATEKQLEQAPGFKFKKS